MANKHIQTILDNEQYFQLTEMKFDTGKTFDRLLKEAVTMLLHQWRETKVVRELDSL